MPENKSYSNSDINASRFSPDSIPVEMKAHVHWCVYGRRTQKGVDALDIKKIQGKTLGKDFIPSLNGFPLWPVVVAKLNKAPFNPITGKAASSNKPETWATFDDAVNAYDRGMFNGVGNFFNYADDSMAGIDIDHTFVDGKPDDDTRKIIENFPNTYVEISPSGEGLHIYALGMPIKCGKGTKNKWLEIYGRDVTGKSSNRYFCVTGNVFENAPSIIADGQTGLAWLHETFKINKQTKKSPAQTPLKTFQTDPQDEAQKVDDALEHINPDDDHDQWLHVGMALHSGGYGCDVWDRWSSRGGKYKPGECQSKWQKFNGSGAIQIGTLFEFARQGGYEFPKKSRQPKPVTENADSDGFLWKNKKGELRLPQHSIAVKYLMKHNYLENYRYSEVDQAWYEYANGFWKKNDRNFSCHLAKTCDKLSLGVGYSLAYKSAISILAQDYRFINQWENNKNFIPFKNGVLNLSNMTLSQHRRGDFFNWQLPYNYEKSATCEPIHEWFHQATQGNIHVIKVLRAFLNAILTGKSNLQKYLELLGQGGTGKSTFLNLARLMIGMENCHTTDLLSIANNHFETSNFFGKRLLLVTDSKRWGGDMSTFKAVTGGDPIRFERKGKDADQSFIFEGIVLLAANEATQSSDLTSGLARRRVTIDFQYKPPRADRKLLEKLTKHLSGLVNWALTMTDQEVEDVIFEHQAEDHLETMSATNPLAAWILGNLHYNHDSFTLVGVKKYISVTTDNTTTRELLDVDSKLYPNFVEYCEVNGIKAIVTKERFKGLVLDICKNQLDIDVEWKRTKKGRGFIGLEIAGDEKAIIQDQLDVQNKGDGGDDGDGEVTAVMTASSHKEYSDDGDDGFHKSTYEKKIEQLDVVDNNAHAYNIDKTQCKPSPPSSSIENNDLRRHQLPSPSRHQAVTISIGEQQGVEILTESEKSELGEFLETIEESRREAVLDDFVGRYKKDSEGAWAWLVTTEGVR